jgi:UDP-GlcNAc:undecaprenyl-phosphate GlcNAc-1-phosphate transferase
MISVMAYLSSTLFMFIFAPLIISVSRKFEILDRPNQRKIHIHYISRLGGVAIFLSIWLTVFFAHELGMVSFESSFWPAIFFGSVIAFLLGLWDDLKNLPAKHKLIFQIFLGLLAFRLGFRIEEIQVGLGNPLQFGHFSMLVTVIWIVTVMNAFNMIDGLDGLAGGFAFFAFATLAVLGYLNGSSNVMIISTVCAGTCLGFLFFNFHPARMFMGDCGSMMLGYILSILAMSSGQDDVTTNILTPFFLLAFPLIDLSTAVLRRMIQAKTTEKDITYLGIVKRTFDADGNHIHHRLLKLGFSQRKIALLMYAFTLVSCLLGLVSVYFSFGLIFFLFIFYVWFTVQCIRLLDYEEFVTGSYRNRKRELEEKRKLSTSPSLIKKVL